MKASLPTAIKVPNQYLNSDNWVMQQKLDGWRVLIETGDNIKCLNRDGMPLDIPEVALGNLVDMKTHWIFDAEYLDKKVYIFDVLEMPTGSIEGFPLKKRLELLENLESKFTPPVYAVRSFYDADKKKEVFKDLKASGKEGVIFKRLDSPYKRGRNRDFLKFKFVKHVDCVVLDRDIDSKSNFALGMFNGSAFEEVGMCSALTGDGPKIDIGDVVQVKILYATESGRLYQPVKPKLRVDKTPYECTVDQLNGLLPDKEVYS